MTGTPSPNRCTTRSDERGEAQAGTASTVRSWLLLEHPGPWGVRALHDARMPDGLAEHLRRLEVEHGIRTLLIRRPIRDPDPRVTAFAIRSGPEEAWIERADLGSLGDTTDLDLASLGRGERPGLAAHDEPLFLVCTHGRHDVCCAERGRPLALALAAERPEATWECSHVGGDRFAANLLTFPHGVYFGRVAPDRGGAIARAYAAGRLELEELRGRSCFAMDVQAAEHAVRTDLGLTGLDDVTPTRVERSGQLVHVTFSTPGGPVTVHLRTTTGPPARLTCRSDVERAAPVYEVLAVRPAR